MPELAAKSKYSLQDDVYFGMMQQAYPVTSENHKYKAKASIQFEMEAVSTLS